MNSRSPISWRLVGGPVGRGKLVELLKGNEELFKTVHNRLLQLSFVERTSEEGKQVRFQISSPLLKEHLVNRGRDLLPSELISRVRSLAVASPSATEPARVMYEVDRALQAAAAASFGRKWDAGIAILEGARKRWGDDRRLLAQLGYYYFRTERRSTALELLQSAIINGQDTAETYTHLALVLLYERRYEDALQQAERALQLRASHDQAHQVAGQAMLYIANRGRLSLDTERKRSLLLTAKGHLESSLRNDGGFSGDAHNVRSQEPLDRVNFEIDQLDL